MKFARNSYELILGLQDQRSLECPEQGHDKTHVGTLIST